MQTLYRNSNNIFLADAVGALISALLLIYLLAPNPAFFGLKADTALLLSIIAFVLSGYSFSCYFFRLANKKDFLKILAIANALYCCLTIAFIAMQFSQITIGGFIYFFIEILLIAGLVAIEWRLSKN